MNKIFLAATILAVSLVYPQYQPNISNKIAQLGMAYVKTDTME